VGAAFPLAYGSSGAVLLSNLPDDQVTGILARAHDACWERQTHKDVSLRIREVRTKGWCADFGMYRSNCHALSAPIHDSQGNVVAALTVIGFSDEMVNESPHELSIVVTEAARQAKEALSNGSRNQVATQAINPLQSLTR
jgi:DNA-binding IclR family transcriptional regulator